FGHGLGRLWFLLGRLGRDLGFRYRRRLGGLRLGFGLRFRLGLRLRFRLGLGFGHRLWFRRRLWARGCGGAARRHRREADLERCRWWALPAHTEEQEQEQPHVHGDRQAHGLPFARRLAAGRRCAFPHFWVVALWVTRLILRTPTLRATSSTSITF